MTLQQLRYFLAVADVRSFTRAAELVGVAQPTLSRQLKALEDELGAPLVDRGAREGPTLTAAGQAVLPFARRILTDADGARTAVAEIVGLARGRVRVGATPSLCSGVLADVLRVFHEQYPGIALELSESGSQPLVRSLVRGELDIALVIVPTSGVDPALHAVPLLRERLSVASAASGRPRLSRLVEDDPAPPTDAWRPSVRGQITIRQIDCRHSDMTQPRPIAQIAQTLAVELEKRCKRPSQPKPIDPSHDQSI